MPRPDRGFLPARGQRKLQALQRSEPDKLVSAVLAYCVLDIGGIDAKAKRQVLEDLTLRDADLLVDGFDRVD